MILMPVIACSAKLLNLLSNSMSDSAGCLRSVLSFSDSASLQRNACNSVMSCSLVLTSSCISDFSEHGCKVRMHMEQNTHSLMIPQRKNERTDLSAIYAKWSNNCLTLDPKSSQPKGF